MKNIFLIIIAQLYSQILLSQDSSFSFNLKNDTSFYSQGQIKQIFITYGTSSVPATFIKASKKKNMNIDVKSGYEKNFFTNAKIQSEGLIIYGCRIGIWLIYDEKGNLLAKKYYSKLNRDNVADRIEVL
jgi:antitoxin component YwqK of YwqJK toxin-antitoxin module